MCNPSGVARTHPTHLPQRGDDFQDVMVEPILPPEEYREQVRRNAWRSPARIGLVRELPADRSLVEWFGARTAWRVGLARAGHTRRAAWEARRGPARPPRGPATR
ncbi:hypothetical protein KCMC57_up15540 [Kitasatospora sp. CMC57]|uniref:Uncharacterized protein n=1 Tax=Kitasatospora sp. CMC57 TaxID=3231513 RepID=A0AB33JXB3_9ACTN